jgi:hypothetical protein
MGRETYARTDDTGRETYVRTDDILVVNMNFIALRDVKPHKPNIPREFLP